MSAALAATPIQPYDVEPFLVVQERRLRRLCPVYVTGAFQAVTGTTERITFLQLLTNVPEELIEEMTDDELQAAVDRKSRKVFNFAYLDARLHDTWQGYGLTLKGLVPDAAQRELILHWLELALIVADARAKRPK